eukprot:235359_1
MSLFTRKLSFSSSQRKKSNSDAYKHRYCVYETRSASPRKRLYLVINESNGDLRIKKSLERSQTNLKYVANIKNIALMIECEECNCSESVRLIIELSATLRLNKGKSMYWDVLFKTQWIRDEVMQLLNTISLKLNTMIVRKREAMHRPSEWISDASVSCCPICNDHFNAVNRRHHCRSCGKVFCHKCSSQRAVLPDLGIRDVVRVCDACYKYIILNRIESNGLLSAQELYQVQSQFNDDKTDECYYGVDRDWRRWIALHYCFDHDLDDDEELRQLLAKGKGIPCLIRGYIWDKHIKHIDIEIEEEDTVQEEHKEDTTLDADLERTFGIHSVFASSHAVRLLRGILMRYSARNSAIGYCQSMNFLGAILLLFVSSDNAFQILSYLMDNVCCLFDQYYYHQTDILGIKIDGAVLTDLIAQYLPHLYEHWTQHIALPMNITAENMVTHLTFNWFLGLFVNTLCLNTLLIIWDHMICVDCDVIFRCALSIFKVKQADIVKCTQLTQIHDVLSRQSIANDSKIQNNAQFIRMCLAQDNEYENLEELIVQRRLFHTNKLNDDYIGSVLYNPSLSIINDNHYKSSQWIMCNEPQIIPVSVQQFKSNTPRRSDDDDSDHGESNTDSEAPFEAQLVISKSFHRDLSRKNNHEDNCNMVMITSPTKTNII